MASRKKPAAKATVAAASGPASKGVARRPPAPAPKPKPAARAKPATPTSPAPKAVERKVPASPVIPPQPAAARDDKPRKPKLVRDSFTIPKNEYTVLEDLKARAARLGRPTKKSELLRAGIKALAIMSDAGFLTTVGAVPAVKTGRPAGK